MWFKIAFLCLVVGQLSALSHFELQPSKEYAHDIDINLYEDNTRIGFISYTKVFLVPFYIIHNLYVYPQYRWQGYGKKLLLYTCNIIKKLGAKRAYIQPGPFEIIKGRTVGVGALYEQEMKRIIALYKKCGFRPIARATALFAVLLYKLMSIDEDARYLMVREF